ncbi:bacteriocin fulvocin C-related protein [Flavobacterium sp. GT3R68]|uniref:bacteriocin fulvocin C-related protein n=1 Tax=Flavobacterium sp. GT3R68 TaxID=2594437 RepID=UPI000F883925|nr:bacteriocin fulvocin C-related protein [Flavobacterium sp. GT3R68]RTY95900.1 hypothetical protein EKL32_04440 [Flavobacterium sp. GSN2]TRW93672.1 bacteriocin fulvocin C-related protein [Flavobacterium sp. GT3R68]
MKKIVFIFIASLAMFSCSTNDIDNKDNVSDKVNLIKIKNVLEINDAISKRVAYRLLNQSEKLKLWNDKLELVLANNNLNSKQKQCIVELQKELKVSVFNNGNDDYKAYFKNIFVKKYLIKIQSSFTMSDIEAIFYNPDSNIISGGGSNDKCNCNKGSLVGCGASGSCEDKRCPDATATGCGFLWAWECNGKCGLLE